MTFIEPAIPLKPEDILRLLLADCGEHWREGDRFAIVEAIAICAEHGREYPNWVTEQINEAFLQFYRATYQDADRWLGCYLRGSGGEGQTDGVPETSVKRPSGEEMEKARQKVNKTLGFSVEKNSIVTRGRNRIRDLVLAELVADRVKIEWEPVPKFKKIRKAWLALERELDTRPPERRERLAAGGHLSKRYIPPECWNATKNIIEKAWGRWRPLLEEEYLGLHQPDGPDDN